MRPGPRGPVVLDGVHVAAPPPHSCDPYHRRCQSRAIDRGGRQGYDPTEESYTMTIGAGLLFLGSNLRISHNRLVL
jgi:hypothetical protein